MSTEAYALHVAGTLGEMVKHAGHTKTAGAFWSAMKHSAPFLGSMALGGLAGSAAGTVGSGGDPAAAIGGMAGGMALGGVTGYHIQKYLAKKQREALAAKRNRTAQDERNLAVLEQLRAGGDI